MRSTRNTSPFSKGEIIMGNSVWYRDDPGYISMSNGLTDVFINVLVLSGSRIAKTDDEKRLIVFLAEKDQSVVGIGTVGFDICEIPWNIDNFSENKAFMLNVIQSAKNKLDWENLDYPPNEEMLFPVLDEFSFLISKINASDIEEGRLEEWIAEAESDDPILCGFPKCEKHGVLLSCFGCQVCNN